MPPILIRDGTIAAAIAETGEDIVRIVPRRRSRAHAPSPVLWPA